MQFSRRGTGRLARLLGTALVAAGLVVTAGPATPATAATPDGYGFAYLDSPSEPIGVGYNPDPAHQFVSSGGAVTIVRNGVGFYSVFLPGVAAAQGVAHVTAVGGAPVWCQVLNYGPAGLVERLDIACVRFGWALQDSRFTVLFSTSTAPPAAPGAYAYLRANAAGAVLNTYNSAGAPNSVTHAGVGQYSVFLSALGSPSIAGNLQVTAVNSAAPARCKVAGWGSTPNGQAARISCFNAAGGLADSGFTLSYQRERAISGSVAPPFRFGYLLDSLGAAVPPATNFNTAFGFGANTAVGAGAGLRLVTFPGVGALQDHVQVTAFGPAPGWCGLLTIWGTSGGNAVVRDVACFDGATGLPLTQQSLVTYTSRF
jgi:hypothetical protein